MTRMNLFAELALSFIVLLLLAMLLPVANIDNVDAILASATFLYGIFYGFEAAVVLQNFSSLKTLLATETAGILSVFNLSKILGGETHQKVEENIEKYLIKAIDYPLVTYVQETNKEFFEIFEPLRQYEPKTEAESAAIAYMHEGLYYIPQSRNQIAQVAPRDVDPPEWGMLLILGSIIIFALFLGRDADIISKIAAAIFSMAVVGSLLLLEEIDSNRIQEAHLEYEMFNRTLDAIGKKRYYPEFALKKGVVKIPIGKEYRVGKFPHYPSLEERHIIDSNDRHIIG